MPTPEPTNTAANDDRYLRMALSATRDDLLTTTIQRRWRQLHAVRTGRAYECPACLGITENGNDVKNHYCPCCGGPSLPRRCEHDPQGAVAELERLNPT